MTPASGNDPDLTRKERREQARTEAQSAGGGRRAAGAAQTHDPARRRDRRRRRDHPRDRARHQRREQRRDRTATGSKKNSTVATVKSTIGGIPQSGNVARQPQRARDTAVLRRPGVPDLQEFTLGALPKVIQKYVRTGKLKIEYHSLETATDEQETFRSSRSPPTPPASRTSRGTSSSSSTTSRARRKRATSTKNTCRASLSRCRG